MNENKKIPYVIVVPNYTRTSAGIKALHLLCHHLNSRGYQSFITCAIANPALITPRMTEDVVKYWNENNIQPIVVYSETISGNPMSASRVVRYLLNYPGHLGGDGQFSSDEFVISWATGMNKHVPPHQEFVLYIPTIDLSVFHPPKESRPRSGSCYYWEKYKNFHHGQLSHFDPSSVEIRRSGDFVQTPHEIAEIFRTKEIFYCYENSMLSLEAMLCGCPVVLIPNEHFGEIICDKDLGMDGMAWGNAAEEVARAQQTVHRVVDNYSRYIALFQTRLDRWIELTQSMPAKRGIGPMKYFELETMPYNKAAKLMVVFMFMFFLLSTKKWNEFASLLRIIFKFNIPEFKSTFISLYQNHKGRLRWILRM